MGGGGGSQGPSPGGDGKKVHYLLLYIADTRLPTYLLSLVSLLLSGQSKDKQSMMTLTVRQLRGASQEHPDDAWKVDGCELHQVRTYPRTRL
jgi:hypothetical protein